MAAVQDCLLPVAGLPATTFFPLCAHGVVALQRWLDQESTSADALPSQAASSGPARSRAQPAKGRALGDRVPPHLSDLTLSEDQER
eukprot:6484816-Amphidinium_carterae.1